MFCPKCGKELPDSAKFCPQCGTAVLGKPQQSSELEPFTFTRDHNEPRQGSTTPQKKNSNSWKVIIGAIGAAIMLIVIIFIVRAHNEKNMIRQIPWLICDDETKDTITSYYGDYLGKSLMVGCNAEDFSAKQGADSNTFDIVGKIEVTDISQDSRPMYDVNVTGTATTNFLRTECSLSYQLQYQTPEPSNNYPDTEAGRILNQYAGSYADGNGNYLFVGADGLGRARASIYGIGNSELSVVLTDCGMNDFGNYASGNDYLLIAGSVPTYEIEMGFYGTDPDILTVSVFYIEVEQERGYTFFKTDPSNIPYTNPYY